MAHTGKRHFLDQELANQRNKQRLRSLNPYQFTEDAVTVRFRGKTLINFSSNDYLGLSKHPGVIKASRKAAEHYGTGSTASRLITGTYRPLHQLEKELAEFTGRGAALVFNSGYQANTTLLKALTTRNSAIYLDKRAHNSLLNGAMVSRAKMFRFSHNDMEHLEYLLQKNSTKHDRNWVVTESVFSMDGDFAPLNEFLNLAETYGALSYVDEAHSIGLYGNNGNGCAHKHPNIDIILGTFGKAFGSFGSFVACSKKMREYLVNFAEGFIFTTALPPAVTGATRYALQLMPELNDRREHLKNLIHVMKQKLDAMGWNTCSSTSQIIPIMTGTEAHTLHLERQFRKNGIIATAIRPPTVPENACRIRITLSSQHSIHQVEKFLKVINSFNNTND